MSSYSRRALVGDLGGTNMRFAISDIDELTISDFAMLASADFVDPLIAIERYLKTIPEPPNMVSLAVAGPVANGAATMTNRPWRFRADEIRNLTGATHVTLINDFAALALALPHLTRNELHAISAGEADRHGTRVVLGPGTGLGVAGLAWAGGEWVALPSEGGHIGFSASTEAEADILRQLTPADGFLSAEDLLSGRGLVRLHALLSGSDIALSPPQIVKRALVEDDPASRRAVEQFTLWLGRFAGDIALVYAAKGGVYIAGGIAPNLVPTMTSGGFRAAFAGKGRLSPYLTSVPIQVVKTGADAGLRGAAVAIARQLKGRHSPERSIA